MLSPAACLNVRRWPAENGERRVLVAEPGAAQDWTSLGARRAAQARQDPLRNADNLKSAIANLNTFTEVLARNSDRIEGLLGGLEQMTGGGRPNRTS